MSQVRLQQYASFRAGDTLAAFVVVGMSAANTVTVPTAGTVIGLGMTQDTANSGASVNVVMAGSAKLLSNSSITAGDLVGYNTDGTGTTTTKTGATTTVAFPKAIGVALENASTNTVFEVWINPHVINRDASA